MALNYDAPPPLMGLDAIVNEFPTYEDYLDNQVTPVDMYYLENEQMARQLVELGYRGEGEILRRKEFESRKEAMYVVNRALGNKKPKKLASAGKEFRNKPLLKALAQREEAVRLHRLRAATENHKLRASVRPKEDIDAHPQRLILLQLGDNELRGERFPELARYNG